MTNKSIRLFTIAIALLFSALIATDASACCGYSSGYGYSAGYAPSYSTYYAPSYSAYYPSTYSTYYGGGYSGWYPGYWMDRLRARMWGSSYGYVAAYPATYTASYAPAYGVSYGGYSTSYAPACSSCSSCSSCCSPCSTCSTCTASYAPSCGCDSCSTGCASCSGCSSCSAPVATQASYQAPQPSCCGYNSGAPSAYAAQPQPQPAGSPPIVAGPGTTVIQQNGAPATPDPRPAIEANQSAPQSTFRNMPTENVQPTPHPEYDVKKTDNSSYLEAPKLFNPKDRTAQRSIAPVRTALYEQPAKFQRASTARATITAEQAQKDAAGWTIGSN